MIAKRNKYKSAIPWNMDGKMKKIYCISTKSFSPLMGPNAASRARAVKSLPEYPSVCLKDKTRQTMRQRSTNKGKECFNDGEGTES